MPRKPIRPSFHFALTFPDGCKCSVESRKDVELTVDTWRAAAIEYLSDYLRQVTQFRSEIDK